MADQLGLDLVEVAADARPPVVRMMDYGKFKYEQSVKAREARKKQSRTVIKEVQFRPKISDNDFDVKRKRVVRFLGEGDKVKVTMRFRGREVTHPEIGRAILDRLVQLVEDHGALETPPKFEGRQMVMVIAPVRTQKPQESQEAQKPSAPPSAEAPVAAPEPEAPAAAAPDAPPAAEKKSPVSIRTE